MNVRIAPLFAGLLAAALVPSAAQAASADTQPFQVTITVTESCNISTGSITDINFGTHARASSATPIDEKGSLQLKCTPGTPYSIAMDHGKHATVETASHDNRRMANSITSPTAFVPYGLYRDPGRTLLWGQKPENQLSGVGTAAAQTISIFGRTPGVDVAAGTYNDTVVATVNY